MRMGGTTHQYLHQRDIRKLSYVEHDEQTAWEFSSTLTRHYADNVHIGMP